MLVLTRGEGEKIRIGDDITICVVQIKGDKVRLGIEAPTDVAVHRLEVYEAIKRQEEEEEDKDDASTCDLICLCGHAHHRHDGNGCDVSGCKCWMFVDAEKDKSDG